ncbi:uncharacterized protein LOC103506526 [Diaphorina citri]|uniref:Uncharacterized protein LOC103506526 n=1 Tax=Diaphorina citri TaxID=121845 RepID=A0A3Q0IRW5_DIACI|nr:uncharacterized protein LOC103506526 [Diaphorina citri]
MSSLAKCCHDIGEYLHSSALLASDNRKTLPTRILEYDRSPSYSSIVLGGKPGQFLGSYCADNSTCNPVLRHVYCNADTHKCECDVLYPVQLGLRKGCAQGEFCSKDLVVIKSDLQTLLGVASGLAIFTAAICFVLKLFVGSKPRSFGNANISTPIIYSSNNAIPLRTSSFKLDSRSSSTAALDTRYIRRGSNGILVTSTRAGAAHAAALLLYSCSQIAHNNNGTTRNTDKEEKELKEKLNTSADEIAKQSASKKSNKKKFRRKESYRKKQSAVNTNTLQLTKAQIAFQKQQEKIQKERILQKASMTHKQRVEEFNRHLDSLTEHFDIPKDEDEVPAPTLAPSFPIEPSTSKLATVHITTTPAPAKPLSLPFAKAQSLGHPLSLPAVINSDCDTEGEGGGNYSVSHFFPAIPLRTSSFKLDSRSSSTAALDTRYIRRGSNGILVTSTRAGAAHAAALLLYSCSQIAHNNNGTTRNTASNSRRSSSISPVHSNHSATSFKSYSARRFERDIEMRLKAAKRRQESTLSLNKPRSTDKLLEDAKVSFPRIDRVWEETKK